MPTTPFNGADLEGQGVLGRAWFVDTSMAEEVVGDEVDIGVVHIAGVGHTLDGLNSDSDNLAGL